MKKRSKKWALAVCLVKVQKTQTGSGMAITARGADAGRKAGSDNEAQPDEGMGRSVSPDMERGKSRRRSITRPLSSDQPAPENFQIFKNLVNCCSTSTCVISG